jgi:hypothetical protein
MTPEELIKAHCDKHERSGRAQFSIAGIRALIDRIASLEAALAPFAKHIEDGMDRDNYGEPLPDEWAVGWMIYLTYGDFRRAAALSSSKQKDDGE